MQLYIEDKNGKILDLYNREYHAKPSATDFDPRYSYIERIAQDGVVEEGDGKVSKIDYKVFFDIVKTNEFDFRYHVNKFKGYFKSRNRPYYLYDKVNGIRSRVGINSVKIKWKPGRERLVSIDNELNLVLLDGHWESSEIVPIEPKVIGPGDSIIVNIPENAQDSFPIIRIKALGAIPEFLLSNQSTGEGILIKEPGLNSSGIIELDSTEGVCRYNNTLKSTLQAGGFPFFLQEGDNLLVYESPSSPHIEISGEYRVRLAE